MEEVINIKIISLSFFFSLIVIFQSSTVFAELSSTVNGQDVTLDRSAMPNAQSNTLYYALADFKGDIDLDTLSSNKNVINKQIYWY